MQFKSFIDLIAEVAAKRIAREGKTKAETPDGDLSAYRQIRSRLWHGRQNFSSFLRSTLGLDAPQKWRQVTQTLSGLPRHR